MFNHLKNKTKSTTLQIRSRSADLSMMAQTPQTFSMAEMPLVPQIASTVILQDQGPYLHMVRYSATTGTAAPVAKKSLDFGQLREIVEPIVVHDTAVQTPLPEVPITPKGPQVI